MSLADPFQVMNAFAITQLVQLVLAEMHPTGFSMKFHPAQPARNRQQPVVERCIPNKGEIQFLEGHVEGRSMTVHFRVGQGAIHIPKDR